MQVLQQEFTVLFLSSLSPEIHSVGERLRHEGPVQRTTGLPTEGTCVLVSITYYRGRLVAEGL